jgi:hypothetical protein
MIFALVCGQSIIYHYFNLFKEDYYVQKIVLFYFSCFGSEHSR